MKIVVGKRVFLDLFRITFETKFYGKYLYQKADIFKIFNLAKEIGLELYVFEPNWNLIKKRIKREPNYYIEITKLPEHVILVPLEEINPKLEDAKRITNNANFQKEIAIALSVNAEKIWRDGDFHFPIKQITTAEILDKARKSKIINATIYNLKQMIENIVETDERDFTPGYVKYKIKNTRFLTGKNLKDTIEYHDLPSPDLIEKYTLLAFMPRMEDGYATILEYPIETPEHNRPLWTMFITVDEVVFTDIRKRKPFKIYLPLDLTEEFLNPIEKFVYWKKENVKELKDYGSPIMPLRDLKLNYNLDLTPELFEDVYEFMMINYINEKKEPKIITIGVTNFINEIQVEKWERRLQDFKSNIKEQ